MQNFGGFGGLDDLFGGARGASSRTGADVRVTVPLSLSEVTTGVEKTVTLRVLEPCETCSATGAEPGSKAQSCATCGGSGEVRRAQRSFFGQFVSVAPCPTCQGEGQLLRAPCHSCRGEGRLRGDRTVTVRIPPGVSNGQYMTLRGVGNAGVRGAPRGDVHVFFEVQEDPRFERDGEDLYTEVLVTYPQLVLGTDLEVAAVDGSVPLRVPPGTQSGQIFHVRGRGLPRLNASGAGDLHVRVQLWTPSDFSAEEQRLLHRLAELRPEVPTDTRSKGFWAKMKEALGA
jgi:molecular chaperone DnaJ